MAKLSLVPKPEETYEIRIAPGVWVRAGLGSDANIGIVAQILNGGTHAEVHHTNALGETILIANYPVEQIFQAQLRDIPKSRRPSVERGRAMGYE